MGHEKRGHILRGVAISLLYSFALLYLMSLFLSYPPLFAAFAVSHSSVYVGLVLFQLLFAPVDTFLQVRVRVRVRVRVDTFLQAALARTLTRTLTLTLTRTLTLTLTLTLTCTIASMTSCSSCRVHRTYVGLSRSSSRPFSKASRAWLGLGLG